MLAPNPDPTIASVFAPPTRIEPDGTVEGYASLFSEIDQARDMMLRGAFADTLTRRGVRRIPMLFQHDPSEPVGLWLDLHEDSRGLYARARIVVAAASWRCRGIVDWLSHRQGPRRSAQPRAQPGGGGSLGNFDCGVPAARARARAVKQATSPPRLSPARTRAERDWDRLAGVTDALPPAIPAPRTRTRAPRREYRRWDGSLINGRLRGWRG
jgi:hypothetical protein